MKIGNFKNKLQTLAYSTKAYQSWLAREQPEDLRIVPTDIWPGQAYQGQIFLTDDFGLGCDDGAVEPPLLLELRKPSGANGQLDVRLHEAHWLRDLRALGGDEARRRARQLIEAWLDRFANWEAQAWALPVLGARIANWLALHDFYCASASDEFRARVFASLASQTRHLGLAMPSQLQGYQFIKALKGLLYGGLCLPGLESYFDKSMSLLTGRLDTLLTPDGFCRERAPLVQLNMLRDLVDIRNLLRQAGMAVPSALNTTIDAMAPALRCVRYGDGGLALFHGGDEGQSVVIEALLQQTGTRSRTKASLSASGFERLTGGRALLLVDTGLPPLPGYDGTAHAGLGAFEFSVGRERLFTNCGSLQRGATGAGGPAWRQALAATAAHNAVVLNDTNAIEVLPEGLGVPPTFFEARREASSAGSPSCRVEITHNAYADLYGVVCHRTLELQADGQVLAGEDQLRGALGLTYAIRFHLHPSVQISLIQDSRAALLKLPSGQGWRFRASNGTVGAMNSASGGSPIILTSSIYAGDAQGQGGHGTQGYRPTKQLVLEGKMTQDAVTVSWVLTREG